MKYTTSLFSGVFSEASTPQTLPLNAMLYHGTKSLFRWAKARRTPQTVKVNYDQERQSYLDRLASLDWDSYVFFPEDLKDFYLVNDRVEWGPLRNPRMLLLERLEAKVRENGYPGAVIVEIGSGDGRNLCYLKSKFPEMHFVGFELSDSSVALSKAAAVKFGIPDVEFFVANACEPLPSFQRQDQVAMCYSNFALEMMPRIFTHAVDQMLALSKKAVVFFEPVDECWSKDLRGLASRMRVFDLDRLSGLAKYLETKTRGSQWQVVKCERSKIGINPINEMVQIEVMKRS